MFTLFLGWTIPTNIQSTVANQPHHRSVNFRISSSTGRKRDLISLCIKVASFPLVNFATNLQYDYTLGSEVKLSYVHAHIAFWNSPQKSLDGTLETGNVRNGMQRVSKLLWSKLSPMGQQFQQQLDSHLCDPLYSLCIIWDPSVNCEKIKVFGTNP